MSEWISIEDRPPEEGDAVFCYGEYGEMFFARYLHTKHGNYFQSTEWAYGDSEEQSAITHWMLAPKAPE